MESPHLKLCGDEEARGARRMCGEEVQTVEAVGRGNWEFLCGVKKSQTKADIRRIYTHPRRENRVSFA